MRYWDLTQEERGALVETDLAKFETFALMEAGIIRPVAPAVLTEEAPQLQRTTMYRPHYSYGNQLDVVFKTPEQAAAFLKLEPMKLESKWLGSGYGSSVEFAKVLDDITFKAVEVAREDDINLRKTELERYAANKQENERARASFDAAMKKVSETTKGMWEDYRECQQLVRDLAAVRAKLAEYTDLCKGDASMARTFVEKAFAAELVDRALGVRPPELARAVATSEAAG